MNIFKILFSIKKVLAYVFSAIAFPIQCISCGSQTYGVVLCKACLDELLTKYEPRENRCDSCGVVLVSEKIKCLECRVDEAEEPIQNSLQKSDFLKDFDSIFPIHHYVLWKKELLFAWKMANNRSLSYVFASLIFQVLQKYYRNIVVVPVPPRSGKIKKRGWDQIDELCKYLNKIYKIQVLRLLYRVSNVEQKKLSRNERIDTLGKTYTLINSIENLPNEVVIIDDIMTTGATLESCARALKEGGVQHIHALTLFYV